MIYSIMIWSTTQLYVSVKLSQYVICILHRPCTLLVSLDIHVPTGYGDGAQSIWVHRRTGISGHTRVELSCLPFLV